MDIEKQHHSPAVLRRQKQIEDCLMDNMLHTPYGSINIADLCRQLGISRRTFYTYYQDKNACLYSLVDRTIRGAFPESFSDAILHPDPQKLCEMQFEYWKTQKRFFDMIAYQDLVILFHKRNVLCFLEEENTLFNQLCTPELETDMDIIYTFVGIRINLLLRWYHRGFDTSVSEMSKKYIRLVHSPIIHL